MNEQQDNNNLLPPHVSRGNDLKFIVDPSLPGVAKHFRLLGIDCAYENNYTDAYVLYLARSENRFIITRSSKLLNKLRVEEQRRVKRLQKLKRLQEQLEEYYRNTRREEWDEDTIEFFQEQIESLEEEICSHTSSNHHFNYYWVNAIGRKKQLREVVQNLRIEYVQEHMFTRCSKCNGVNRTVEDKSLVRGRVHDNVWEENDQFAMCDQCSWVTWGTIEQNAKYLSQINIYLNAVRFCKEYSYQPHFEEASSNGATPVTTSSSNHCTE